MAGIPVKGSSEKEGKAWGQGSFANMPQEVTMAAYPKEAYMSGPALDDTSTRIDGDAKQVKRGERKNLDRGMY